MPHPPIRGNVVEAFEAEREAVMRVEIEPVTLSLREGVARFMGMRSAIKDTDALIRQQASRMAELIIQRVRAGGEVSVRINPQRSAPNHSDLYALLVRKLNEQRGRCALCQGSMVLDRKLGMLQPSTDRIDSGNGAYNDENVWITHLACNLAKNKYGFDEFEEWVDLIRSSVAGPEEVRRIGASSDDLTLLVK